MPRHLCLQFYAAKAFDVLERLDPAPEYIEGKKGGIAGTFQVRTRLWKQ